MNDQIASKGLGAVLVPVSESPAAVHELQKRLASAEREIEILHASLANATARETMLKHELQHRVRNMLAVIRSIFRRTRESGASQDQFAEHFEGRLGAIARYQLGMAGIGSVSVELEDIVRDELLEVGCSDGSACTIAGPSVCLRGKLLELISLAVHELTTNSIKFGAIAQSGAIHIEWFVEGPQDEPTIHFQWRESGVPIVAAGPRARGFGRQLIEEALPYQLGAATSFTLKPGGLDCSIVLKLAGPQCAAEFASGEPMEEFSQQFSRRSDTHDPL